MIDAAPRDLDPDTRAYLRRVADLAGNDDFGIFVPGTRGGVWGPIVVGAILLALGGSLLVKLAPNLALGDPVPWWSVLLLALGGLAVGAGLDTLLRRRRSAGYLGDFTFVDPDYWWEVAAHRVKATPIGDARGVEAYRASGPGSSLQTEIRVTLPSGTFVRRLDQPVKAEMAARYLATVVGLRRAAETGEGTAAAVRGTLLGRLAKAVMRGENRVDIPGGGAGTEIPRPRATPTGFRHRRTAVLAAAAAAGVVCAMWVVPALAVRRFDERQFARVRAATPGDFAPYEEYLARLPHGRHREEVIRLRDDRTFEWARAAPSRDLSRFALYFQHVPDGRHAQEVRDLKDDRLFAIAREDSGIQGTSTALREYLADEGNRRHRGEAQALIAVYYDSAVSRLRDLAEDGADVDRSLFDALVLLLEGLKTAGSPVVTVGFRATQEPAPATEDGRRKEAEAHAVMAATYPEVGRIAEGRPDRSAIVDLGATFEPAQVAHRQQVILDRLKAAIETVLAADLLELRPADEAAAATIEIAYHTCPSGGLYRYVQTTSLLPGGTGTVPGGIQREVTKGLLRGYRLDWTVTIRPAGRDDGITHRVESQPLGQLQIDSRPGDPDWAPYAVMLYSAFHNFSSQLIRGFGLEAPPEPNAFTFVEALSRRAAERPADPITLSPEQMTEMMRRLGEERGFSLPGPRGADRVTPSTSSDASPPDAS